MSKKGRITNKERDQKKEEAVNLFIRGYSIQTISEMVKISISTLRKWAKENDWDAEKENAKISPKEIQSIIRKCIIAAKNGKPMPYTADSVSKLASAWNKLDDPEKKAVLTMEAYNDFINFLLDKAIKVKPEKRKKELAFIQKIRELQDEHMNTMR
jgi:transposase